MQNRPLIVFNRQAISDWQLEFKAIPAQIEQLKANQAPYSNAIAQLTPQLTLVNAQLSPIDNAIASIEISLSSLQVIDAIDTGVHVAEIFQKSGHSHRHSVGHVVRDVVRSREIAQLKAQLHRLKGQRSPLALQKQDIESTISSNQNYFNTLEQEIIQKRQRSIELAGLINEATIFLSKLADSPQELCTSLAAALSANLESYNKAHPRNQSEPVRICLLQLTNKVKFIQEIVTAGQQDGFSPESKKAWQLKYAQLCGLLWYTFDQLPGDADAEDLAAVIQKSLNSTHIDRNGDLPNEFYLYRGCVSLYQELQQQYPDSLRDLGVAELLAMEEATYQQALTTLRTTLRTTITGRNSVLLDFVDKGNAVADRIDFIKKASQQNNEGSHLVLRFTESLNKTKALALNPTNRQLQTQYKDMADEADGSPDCCWSFGGVMLLFLGSAIVITSIIALAGSCGASSVGLGIGTTALAKGLSALGIGVGLGTIGASFKFFKNGERKGTSKNLMDFARSAETIGVDPERSEEPSAAPPPYREPEQQHYLPAPGFGNYAPTIAPVPEYTGSLLEVKPQQSSVSRSATDDNRPPPTNPGYVGPDVEPVGYRP